MREIRTSILALVIALVAAAVIGTGSAFAGEITGNGGTTQAPANANSECAFSGLDDPDDDGFVHTQNWGRLSRRRARSWRRSGLPRGRSATGT